MCCVVLWLGCGGAQVDLGTVVSWLVLYHGDEVSK